MTEQSVQRLDQPARTPRVLTAVSVASWCALIVAAISIDINEDPPMPRLVLAMAAFVLLFVAPVAAIGASFPARDHSPLTTRVRRISTLCGLLGLIALWPTFANYPFNELNTAIGLGGFFALMLAPGARVYRSPSTLKAFVWAVWMAPFAALAFLVDFDRPTGEWDVRCCSSGSAASSCWS